MHYPLVLTTVFAAAVGLAAVTVPAHAGTHKRSSGAHARMASEVEALPERRTSWTSTLESFGFISSSPQQAGSVLSSDVKVTWYAAHDLLNPACGTGDWSPTSNSMIGAISTDWKDGPACGQFVDICNEKSDGDKTRCVTVRRIDDCAGCQGAHMDLTKEAFTALAGDLDIGEVHGLKMYHHKPKSDKWSLNIFGPVKIGW